MKQRLFIILLLCLMACSRKPAFNNGAAALNLQFAEENELLPLLFKNPALIEVPASRQVIKTPAPVNYRPELSRTVSANQFDLTVPGRIPAPVNDTGSAPKKTGRHEWKGTAGFIISTLGVIPPGFFSIIAIIFCSHALRKLSGSKNKQAVNLAKAGLVLGVLGLGAWMTVFVLAVGIVLAEIFYGL